MRAPQRLLGTVAGLVLAGCGVAGIDETGVVGGGPAVSVFSGGSGVEVCLTEQEALVVAERRDVTYDGHWTGETSLFARALATIESLLSLGPTQDEIVRGLGSSVPGGLRLEVVAEPDIAASGTTDTMPDSIRVPFVGPDPTAFHVMIDSGSEPVSGLGVVQIACTVSRFLVLFGFAEDVYLYDGTGSLLGTIRDVLLTSQPVS